MDEVFLFLGAFILAIALSFWTITIVMMRLRLLRQIAKQREKVREVQERVAVLVGRKVMLERTTTVILQPKEEDRVEALQMEAADLRARVFKDWGPSEQSLSEKAYRLRLLSWVDWPFWAWWKLFYWVSDMASDMAFFLFVSDAALLVLVPRNRVGLLMERLSLGKAAYERYMQLVEILEKSLSVMEEALETERANRAAEKERVALEALLAKIADLQGKIQKAILLHRNKIYLTGPDVLDAERAESAWLKKLAGVDQETEPEIRVKMLQRLSEFFEPGPGGKSWILAAAEIVLDTRKDLRGINDNLEEIGEKMGEKPEWPPELIRAERLVKVAPRFVYHLDDVAFSNAKSQLRELKNQAVIRVNDLKGLVGVILSLKEKVAWILRMEGVLAAHGVPTETLEDLDKVNVLLERKAPEAWKEGKEKEVSDILKQARETLNLRVISMATRVDEKAEKVLMDPDIPEEAVKRLRELQQRLLRGPEDDGRQTRFVQPSQAKTYSLSGDVVQSALGTVMSDTDTLKKAWEGTDARKKQNGEEHTRK